jgi:hypothetical protein
MDLKIFFLLEKKNNKKKLFHSDINKNENEIILIFDFKFYSKIILWWRTQY